MQFAEEHYRAAKRRAERRLFSIPGVVSIAIGPKFVNGMRTTIPAIQIRVERKRARTEVPPADLIPTTIDGVATDVLEGMFPVEMSATVRCRRGTIRAAAVGFGAQITSPGHGLTNGAYVRLFGVPISSQWAVPIIVTEADVDVFTLPAEIEVVAEPIRDFASWTEVSSFQVGMCCCRSGAITDAASGNPVTITSAGHRLSSGDRVKISRIDRMHELRGREFIVGKTTTDTFELPVDGTTFNMSGIGMENGEWERVCIAPSGRIQRVRTGASVVFTSQGHTLKPRDRVHIISTSPTFPDPSSPISSWNRDEPYTVESADGDTFTVKELANIGSEGVTDIIGCWIRILEDRRRYSRVRGGIRIAMSSDEVSHGRPLISMATTQQGGTVDQSGTIETHITYGTLGCVAVENETNTKLLLSNYHVLWSAEDVNVHHPEYSSCKSRKIAERMRRADAGTPEAPGAVDAGIARLTKPSDPMIVDIGEVKGVWNIRLEEILDARRYPLGYRVRKRGCTTLLTEGVVVSLDHVYNTPRDSPPVHLTNQIFVDPLPGEGLGAFCLKGDSGAALVNDDNQVVGLVCGGDALGHGIASPIRAIREQLGIEILEAPSATPGGGGPPPDAELLIMPPIPELLSAVITEVSATPDGAHLVSLALEHHREVAHLVHHNRRVMVAWHRNGGPAFLSELLQFVVRRNAPLPELVEGSSVQGCMDRFCDALHTCASAKLASDLARHRDEFVQLSGLTYAGMLDRLAASGGALRA
jgi:hypothetical protein